MTNPVVLPRLTETMEVEAIDAGVLCEILVGDNEIATVGQTVAKLADSAQEC